MPLHVVGVVPLNGHRVHRRALFGVKARAFLPSTRSALVRLRADAVDDAFEMGERADERLAVAVDLKRTVVRRRSPAHELLVEQPGESELVRPLLIVSMDGEVAPFSRVAHDRLVSPCAQGALQAASSSTG